MAELLTVILAVVTLMIVVWYWWSAADGLSHIPSPKGWPFIGNLLSMDDKSAHLTFTSWSKELGAVFCVKVKEKMVVLNSFEAIYEAIVKKERKHCRASTEENVPS